MALRPDLVIANGEMSGRRFSVGQGALRLGRSSSNDIHVPDAELSRNHCLFEPVGESGLRITDLASANGTVVNGVPIGSDPVELKEGDVIEVGQTVLRVGDGAEVSAGSVDLGLGTRAAAEEPAPPRRRSPVANVLWTVAVLSACGAIALILMTPDRAESDVPKSVVPEAAPVILEMSYEKVEASAKGIFRFALALSDDGLMSVKIDDTSNDRRMPLKQKPLSKDGHDELNKILARDCLAEFDREYVGVEPDPPAVNSQVLRVVYSTDVREVAVVNADEPEGFSKLREKLEAFSKSELGVWAISYSRERLIELAEDSVRVGDAKWEERDVNYGNLSDSIVAYQEAVFYLETVNPKPECAALAASGLERAKRELKNRYDNQRFQADKALNLSQWETARDELQILLEMIPDPRDDRNREARLKLISAETNLKKKGGRR